MSSITQLVSADQSENELYRNYSLFLFFHHLSFSSLTLFHFSVSTTILFSPTLFSESPLLLPSRCTALPPPPVISPFVLSSLLFLPPTSVYLSVWAPVVCLLFASFSFTQTENHKRSTETHTVCHSKGKHHPPPSPSLFLTHSLSPEAELAHTSTANKTHSALQSLPQISALLFGSTVRRIRG